MKTLVRFDSAGVSGHVTDSDTEIGAGTTLTQTVEFEFGGVDPIGLLKPVARRSLSTEFEAFLEKSKAPIEAEASGP